MSTPAGFILDPPQRNTDPPGFIPDAPASTTAPVAADRGVIGGNVVEGAKYIAELFKVPVEGLWGLVKTGGRLFSDPGSVMQDVGNIAEAVFPAAREGSAAVRDVAAGNLGSAVDHATRVVPFFDLIDKQTKAWADMIRNGEGARAQAEITWAVTGLAKSGTSTPKAGASARPMNVQEAAAIQFLRDRGVKVPAGPATGNSALTGMQELAEHGTVLGSRNQSKSAVAMSGKMSQIADDLGAQTGVPALTSLEAGQGVQSSLSSVTQRLAAEARGAYQKLEGLVAGTPSQTRSVAPGAPVRSMRVAVDLRSQKPVYAAELYRLQGAVRAGGRLQGAEAEAATALQALVEQPDFAPLLDVEAARGTLLAALRQMPGGVKGSSALARAERELNRSILRTAVDADASAAAAKQPNGFLDALTEGRSKTAEKYRVQAIVDELEKGAGTIEPAKIAERLIGSSADRGIEQVRKIAAVAPDAMPQLGRAFLQNLFEKARGEGGFAHADKLWSDWQKMGDQTKKILFKDALAQDPNYLRNLDQFFLGAKVLQRQFNPSGSGRAAALMLAHGGMAATTGIIGSPMALAESIGVSMMSEAGGLLTSRLLRDPKFVSLLAGQIKNPVTAATSVAARTARSTALAQAFHDASMGQGFQSLPAFAQTTAPATPVGTRK